VPAGVTDVITLRIGGEVENGALSEVSTLELGPPVMGDEKEIEEELIGIIGRHHCDVNRVSTVCQFWCLKVDDQSAGVKSWFLGIDYNMG
jgi:hypothetical protein